MSVSTPTHGVLPACALACLHCAGQSLVQNVCIRSWLLYEKAEFMHVPLQKL